MKKLFHILFVAMALTIAGVAFGFTPPAFTSSVVDQAGALTSDQKSQLDHKLQAYRDTSHNQIGILTIQSLGDDNVDDVAYQTFNTWKVGDAGKDNGVLIVLAIADHKWRIETGKGVGGELTDLQSNQIGQAMAKHFKQGHYYDGLDNGVDAITKVLDHRASGPAAHPPNQSMPLWQKIGIGILILIILLIVLSGNAGILISIVSGDGSSGGDSGGWSGGGGSGGSSGGGGSSGSW